MKKTRLGNDIAVTIALFTLNADGEREPYALGDNSLSLTASTALDTAQMQIATVAGNIVEAILPGSAQRATGVYSLTLREEHGESSRVVDICDAFEIVSCSCEAGGADIANNTTLGYEAVVVVVSPSLSAESSTFVSTATEQAFTPEQQLRGRTNIGLPVHRLWMTLDRSQGLEGVVCICRRAEGYAEENAATVAAMTAAMTAATRDMFLITIFDGDTAVTGELNCIAAEQWVAEIEVGADPAAIHKWVYTVDCELVALGDIDRGRVVFASTPGDIARGAVITGSRSLELSSEQIGIARGNMQIYTVVCDTEGNLLTTASRLAVAKMSEVQQDPSKRLDSLFLVKLVDGDTFYTVAMTLKGGYWLGATPYNKLPNNDTPLAYLLIEATIVDGVFNLTLRRLLLMTFDLFASMRPLIANGLTSFTDAQLVQLRANMHLTDTWLLSAKPRITIFYPLDAAKGNVPRMTITHPLAEAGGVEGEFVLMRWQRRGQIREGQEGCFKPRRWCAAKPVMIQLAGWDPDQDPLPESMRKPYIFTPDVRGNDFYKTLVDILLYTAYYTDPAEEGDKVRGEAPLWLGEVAEGWEAYLYYGDRKVRYCWARGAHTCDIGIAYRVLNPAYEGHVSATPDGIPAPDPNEEWQAWDAKGNPRWLYSNVAPMRISRGGAITKSYRNEQVVRYPLLRVVEK